MIEKNIKQIGITIWILRFFHRNYYHSQYQKTKGVDNNRLPTLFLAKNQRGQDFGQRYSEKIAPCRNWTLVLYCSVYHICLMNY